MECEKCGEELNGDPKQSFIDRYGYLNNKYGTKKNLCIKCYNEVNN